MTVLRLPKLADVGRGASAKIVAHMGYETRHGKKYYYRSVREGGRVRKRYIGAGPAGAVAAEQLAKVQAQRTQERLAMLQRMDRLRADLEQLRTVDEQIEDHIHALLVAGGFRRHHRGEWRRRIDSGEHRKRHR